MRIRIAIRYIMVAALLALAVLAGAARPAHAKRPRLSRTDFNRLAVQANLPLFWTWDRNRNETLDPDELALTDPGMPLTPYLSRGRFTARFKREHDRLVQLRRREAVAAELDGGRPTLVYTDMSQAPAQDRVLLGQLRAAAEIIEGLYLRQTGAWRYRAQIARAEPADRSLFWRNHGPWCHTPKVSKDPFCNGLASFPEKRSEAYPDEMKHDDTMCQMLQRHQNAKQLLDPFTVVRRRGGKLVALPITDVWGGPMRAVARRLRASAKLLATDIREKAFRRYLLAAARGFETNDWSGADEAWAAMNSQNSRWYLRVGPDEVYFDPCQQKAGFHLSLALIDRDSVAWQKKLTALRTTMEQSMARLIGKPYTAREVRFHMPDFIRLVLNAGDSRHPLGAIIGQSLPNWGKVAQEGRGRTVVMSNLYTDPDSVRIGKLKARSLLSKATMSHYSSDPQIFLIDIILHEACHNFGPHSDYRIRGKRPKEIFGGKLASTLEELKAQTGALWYLQLLHKKGLLDDAKLKQAYVNGIVWAFGHISRGMFTPTGNVRPYSQLAAVQVGSFMEDGAMSYSKGKFTIHFDKLPRSVERLMRRVGRLKATGDEKAAGKLIDHFIKGKGHRLVHEKHIARQLLRYPKATFLYSVIY